MPFLWNAHLRYSKRTKEIQLYHFILYYIYTNFIVNIDVYFDHQCHVDNMLLLSR